MREKLKLPLEELSLFCWKLTKIIYWNCYVKHKAWRGIQVCIKAYLESGCSKSEYWSNRLDYLLAEYRAIEKEMRWRGKDV